MTRIERFETERMRAEPPGADDAAFLARIFGDPEAARTLGGTRSAEEVAETLERFRTHFHEHGFGPWLFRDRASGEFVGYAGLRHVHVDEREEIELLYAVVPAFWRQGRAVEMARRVVGIAFADLGLDALVAFALRTNRGSRRVMERVGFPHVFYRLTRDAWRARESRRTPEPASAALRVVFVCVENSNRSQMAEAFARASGSEGVASFSAGSRPSGRVNPRAVAMMRELGCELSGARSKGLDALPDVEFDAVVTMGCGDACPHLRARSREDWALPDPRELAGDDFRRVRDEIGARVRDLLARLRPGDTEFS